MFTPWLFKSWTMLEIPTVEVGEKECQDLLYKMLHWNLCFYSLWSRANLLSVYIFSPESQTSMWRRTHSIGPQVTGMYGLSLHRLLRDAFPQVIILNELHLAAPLYTPSEGLFKLFFFFLFLFKYPDYSLFFLIKEITVREYKFIVYKNT